MDQEPRDSYIRKLGSYFVQTGFKCCQVLQFYTTYCIDKIPTVITRKTSPVPTTFLDFGRSLTSSVRTRVDRLHANMYCLKTIEAKQNNHTSVRTVYTRGKEKHNLSGAHVHVICSREQRAPADLRNWYLPTHTV